MTIRTLTLMPPHRSAHATSSVASRSVAPVATALAALLVLALLPGAHAAAQTPYDVEDEPATEPVTPPVTEPDAPDDEALPDVRDLPPDPIATDPTSPVTIVDGVVTPSERFDGTQPSSDAEDAIARIPGAAVGEGGTTLLLPIGPAGTAQELPIGTVRITSVGGSTVVVLVQDPTRAVVAQDPGARLRATRADRLRVVVGGFAPRSIARVRLHSDPLLVGDFEVSDEGTLDITAELPADFPLGPHALQIDGVLPGGSVVRISEPVEVLDAADEPAAEPEPEPEPEQEPEALPAPDDAGPEPEADDAGAGLVPLFAIALVAVVVLLLVGRRRGASGDGEAARSGTGSKGTGGSSGTSGGSGTSGA